MNSYGGIINSNPVVFLAILLTFILLLLAFILVIFNYSSDKKQTRLVRSLLSTEFTLAVILSILALTFAMVFYNNKIGNDVMQYSFTYNAAQTSTSAQVNAQVTKGLGQFILIALVCIILLAYIFNMWSCCFRRRKSNSDGVDEDSQKPLTPKIINRHNSNLFLEEGPEIIKDTSTLVRTPTDDEEQHHLQQQQQQQYMYQYQYGQIYNQYPHPMTNYAMQYPTYAAASSTPANNATTTTTAAVAAAYGLRPYSMASVGSSGGVYANNYASAQQQYQQQQYQQQYYLQQQQSQQQYHEGDDIAVLDTNNTNHQDIHASIHELENEYQGLRAQRIDSVDLGATAGGGPAAAASSPSRYTAVQSEFGGNTMRK